MSSKNKLEAQNPLILRCHRLMEAFAKSDEERDFYIDRLEGFLLYVDLDKAQEELDSFEEELRENKDRYCPIPKLSFYETKKIMEGFVNEKVYDIDTKEKLLDIIQSKEARENFLEFICDHHSELEKWQQYYQERSRIRLIEWLRVNHFHFVFEEDLDFPKALLEKIKQSLFQAKVGKDIAAARKTLQTKAKTYYSNEALNPRPKRGRPPKQAVKQEVEPQVTIDVFTTVPSAVRPFLFLPELQSSTIFSLFSSKFESGAESSKKEGEEGSLTQKLAALRSLSSKWVDKEEENNPYAIDNSFDDDGDDDDELEEAPRSKKKSAKQAKLKPSAAKIKKTAVKEKEPEKTKKLKKIMPKKEAAIGKARAKIK